MTTRHATSAFIAAFAAVMSSSLPATANAACDVARFGEAATNTCRRSESTCVPAYLPAEIRAIVRGAVVESVGLAVNDGRASWRGFDLDRRELVVVERYAGARLAQAPRVTTATADEYVKPFAADPARGVDHVRRYPLAAAKFTAMACLASAAWSEGQAPSHALTDISGQFFLLLADAAKTQSVLGRFEGTPGKLVRQFDGVMMRQRPGRAAP